MKVLMLNGSCNANGSTRAGLDVMAETFAAENVETEIVTLGGKPIMDCIGCGKCAELKRCVFGNDDVARPNFCSFSYLLFQRDRLDGQYYEFF